MPDEREDNVGMRVSLNGSGLGPSLCPCCLAVAQSRDASLGPHTYSFG